MPAALERLARRTAGHLAKKRVEKQVRRALGGRPSREIFTHLTQTGLHWLFQTASRLPGNSVALEVGSHLGASSVYLAAGLGPSGKLLCVDTWENQGMQEGMQDTFAAFQRNTARLATVITAVRLPSRAALPTLPGPFQLAFIVGDHSYEGVRDDLQLISAKMAPDGVLALHDWRYFPGVTQAVMEFIRASDWKPGGFVDNLIHLKREKP